MGGASSRMDDVIANSPYKLGVVSIEGNKATREDLILRQLKSVREATTFGEIQCAVSDGIERLQKLGIFDDVKCTLDSGNDVGNGSTLTMISNSILSIDSFQ